MAPSNEQLYVQWFPNHERYVFPEKNTLVKYLYTILSHPSPIKVQKTVYFLYAFYGASYGALNGNENNEHVYPKELFPARFQAWRYGPVDIDIYKDQKEGLFDDISKEMSGEYLLFIDATEKQNIKQFIHTIVRQTDNIDDFSLVDRTHQDDVWFDHYNSNIIPAQMNNIGIVTEYRERYLKRSDHHDQSKPI